MHELLNQGVRIRAAREDGLTQAGGDMEKLLKTLGYSICFRK
jgi:hypothetical protein